MNISKKENNEKIKKRMLFQSVLKEYDNSFINFYKIIMGDEKENRKYELYKLQCKINENYQENNMKL